LPNFLPDNWEVLVETLTNSTSNGKSIMSTVKKRMLDEEARRNKCGLIDRHTQLRAIIIRSRGINQTRNFISMTNLRVNASQEESLKI
jgi:hypothetical protein